MSNTQPSIEQQIYDAEVNMEYNQDRYNRMTFADACTANGDMVARNIEYYKRLIKTLKEQHDSTTNI